jgi:ribosomal protein S18 acetylase RimI-like enzyme
MGDIKIIKAKRQHVPAVLELWKDFMDFHAATDPFYTRRPRGHLAYEKMILNSFGQRSKQLFVAMDGDKVVGYAYVEISKYPPVIHHTHYGYIGDMYTDPAYRRQGLGKLMYAVVVDWFRKKGVKHMELGAVSSNKVAQSFWRKMGFYERMKRMYQPL